VNIIDSPTAESSQFEVISMTVGIWFREFSRFPKHGSWPTWARNAA